MTSDARRFDRSRRVFMQRAARGGGFALLASYLPVHAQPQTLAISGIVVRELTALDTFMTTFVQEQRIPGAALAATKDGRLVYARGFGTADRGRNEDVKPTALFRIGSVSKPLTAVAVLQLVERGRIALDDKVWDTLALPEPADPRWKQITLLHLLQHTGGWDRRRNFDPMFAAAHIAKTLDVALPLTVHDVVRYMLAQPLDFEPGARHAYSNFGYCLLGRVIERVAGLAYERYVQQEVLAPLGIRRMRLGKTLITQRAPGEVVYYDDQQRFGPAIVGRVGERVPFPYGVWSMDLMDANGAWLGSAVDLVRFTSAFDDPQTCRILRPESIAAMFRRPEGVAGIEVEGNYYGCGWTVWNSERPDRAHASHAGLIPGTAAYLARRHDGVNWAALFNTMNGADGRQLANKIRDAMPKALERVSAWPASDAFSGLL
ncbi:MAG TPA: serine hydrolase domain-containing protein [Burkholderiales bacterium]|nr:serine hydrolase domain-containing protein [Burkholderiales bacterium]